MMENNHITIRDMVPEEKRALHKVAVKSFSPLEALGAIFTTPKQAVVATVNDDIAGGMYWKVFKGREGRKIGYLELGFVSKAYRGKGIGGMVYPAAMQKLKDEGCDTIVSMVTDDNASSWGLLQRHGYSKATFIDMLREFGLVTSLSLWIGTFFCFTFGYNFWISKPVKEQKSLPEMGTFLLLNLFIMLIHSILFLPENGFNMTSLYAGFIVMAMGILSGGIGCLISGEQWQFGLTRGGFLLPPFIGNFFPILGRWYPKEYQNTIQQKKAMGLQATIEWLILLLFYMSLLFFAGDGELQQRLIPFSSTILFLRIIPISPLGHFGGERVFSWNKTVYILLVIATLGSLWVV